LAGALPIAVNQAQNPELLRNKGRLGQTTPGGPRNEISKRRSINWSDICEKHLTAATRQPLDNNLLPFVV
jgi:hypothetical protein